MMDTFTVKALWQRLRMRKRRRVKAETKDNEQV